MAGPMEAKPNMCKASLYLVRIRKKTAAISCIFHDF